MEKLIRMPTLTITQPTNGYRFRSDSQPWANNKEPSQGPLLRPENFRTQDDGNLRQRLQVILFNPPCYPVERGQLTPTG